jgi:hypothetical protein
MDPVFGRTGAWFGVDHEGVVPDLMTMAKGLASGYVPTGAVVLREPLSQALEKRYLPLGGTFSGHPLACAAALACLAEYEERGLIENARRLGGGVAHPNSHAGADTHDQYRTCPGGTPEAPGLLPGGPRRRGQAPCPYPSAARHRLPVGDRQRRPVLLGEHHQPVEAAI